MTDNRSPFTSPYKPADPANGIAFEEKAIRALDHIAHYLGQIDRHLSALASNANQPPLSEAKKRIVASLGTSRAQSRKLEDQE